MPCVHRPESWDKGRTSKILGEQQQQRLGSTISIERMKQDQGAIWHNALDDKGKFLDITNVTKEENTYLNKVEHIPRK